MSSRSIFSACLLLAVFSAPQAHAQVLYVANFGDEGTGVIDQVAINSDGTAGAVTTYATGLSGTAQLAIDGSGNLYAADSYRTTSGIFQVAPGGTVSLYANSSEAGNPEAVTVDAMGRVYAGSNSGQSAIYQFTAAHTGTTVTSNAGQYIQSLAINSAGNLFGVVGGGSNANLVEITPGGMVTTLYSNLNPGEGLLFDSAGNLFAADGGSVLEFTALSLASANPTPSTYATGLSSADFLAFDNSGNLYVTGSNNIYKVGAGGGVATLFASNVVSNESGIVFEGPSSVPEPSTCALVMGGLVILVSAARRRLVG